MPHPSTGRHAAPRTAALLLAAALGAAALPACGASRAARGTRGAESVRTTLRVQNQNFLDMAVYVVRGGVRSRLGTAPGNRTTTFTIPASFVAGITPLRFQADPIGARRAPVSEEITVSPGDEVGILIPPG